jgi:uncharacterized protein
MGEKAMNHRTLFAALGLVSLIAAGGPASAAVIDITWADLIPASALIGGKPANVLGGVVQHSQVSNAAEAAGASQPTTSIEQLLGITSGVAYRNDLDHKDVKLSGFILPLQFNGSKVTQFLLVPFVGACVHVPPPPANQLVLVDVPQGYTTTGLWEPVSVTGTLSVSGISTELAQVGYSMKAIGINHI